ncbi:MAG: hypothetical protein HYV01_14085 [Deltaproteobacteria bacterium]|nr:hypothetical protein [Deltaproteobacteria bacterium]
MAAIVKTTIPLKGMRVMPPVVMPNVAPKVMIITSPVVTLPPPRMSISPPVMPLPLSVVIVAPEMALGIAIFRISRGGDPWRYQRTRYKSRHNDASESFHMTPSF